MLLITARRAPDAAASDQVMLAALRGDYQLERTAAWDALGMRGTCSDGFRLYLTADREQVLPVLAGDRQPNSCCRFRICYGAACGLVSPPTR